MPRSARHTPGGYVYHTLNWATARPTLCRKQPDYDALSSLRRARSTSDFDDQGRVYRTQTFSVDQSNGTLSTNALTTNTWYDQQFPVSEKPCTLWGACAVPFANSLIFCPRKHLSSNYVSSSSRHPQTSQC
jgi:hypothetical protein